MTSEFDPDKWWTLPVPRDYVLTRREDGSIRSCSTEGWAWIDGFVAGRNSLAEEILERERALSTLPPTYMTEANEV